MYITAIYAIGGVCQSIPITGGKDVETYGLTWFNLLSWVVEDWILFTSKCMGNEDYFL